MIESSTGNAPAHTAINQREGSCKILEYLPYCCIRTISYYSHVNPALHPASSYCTRIPGLVREHRADKAKDDIRNSARTKGCVLKTRRIPRTLSALLLVEQSIQGFYWIFATLAHAQNKSWCSRTNPDTRVLEILFCFVLFLKKRRH